MSSRERCPGRSRGRALHYSSRKTTLRGFAMFEADKSLGVHRWHVVRLPAGTSTEVVLLSPSFFCVTTHWHKCTLLCAIDSCPLCSVLPARGLFYIAVHCLSQVRMVELGAQSAAHLEQHCKLLHGGMIPGQVISLKRRSAKAPVNSEVVRFQENVSAVTQLNLAKHVMALYKFPPPNPSETIETYSVRIQESVRLRNERIAGELLARK